MMRAYNSHVDMTQNVHDFYHYWALSM